MRIEQFRQHQRQLDGNADELGWIAGLRLHDIFHSGQWHLGERHEFHFHHNLILLCFTNK